MTREHAINYMRSSGFTAEQIKDVADALSTQPDNDRIWNALSKVYNMDGVPDEAKSIIGDVMLGLGEQPEPVWHECFYDDPASFPDDERMVLMSFSNFPTPAVGWFERDDEGGYWTDGGQKTLVEYGLFVDGWWELPKKPEGRDK